MREALRAAHEALASCDVALLTRDELLESLDDLETLTCQLPAVTHGLLARLQVKTTAKDLGAKDEPESLRHSDDPAEPGGPAPPTDHAA